MGRELLQARCDPDTAEQVEDAKDEMDISKSEFVRRALREKLQREGYRPTAISAPEDVPDDTTTKYVVATGEDAVEELNQREDHASANTRTEYRLVGGGMIAGALLVLTLVQFGVI